MRQPTDLSFQDSPEVCTLKFMNSCLVRWLPKGRKQIYVPFLIMHTLKWCINNAVIPRATYRVFQWEQWINNYLLLASYSQLFN
jgi:hypothetical protein